jgi:membrane protein implicated in regulation of membrane protease activity
VALGITLGTLEMVTMSFFLAWPAVAALIMAGLLGLFPTMPGEVQVAVFAALGIVLTWVGRAWLISKPGQPSPNGLNERSNRLVGMTGKVLSADNGEGRVEIEGIPWVAHWQEGSGTPGATVTVTETRGTVLIVRN